MNSHVKNGVSHEVAAKLYDDPVHEVTVEFGDCDPAGIVFYPNYFRWFDQATWRLFARAGYTSEILFDRFKLLGHPLVKTGSDFMNPAPQGTVLSIESRILAWGRTSFTIGHQFRATTGDLCARGQEVRIWAGHGTGDRPITALPIPEEVRTRMPALNWPE